MCGVGAAVDRCARAILLLAALPVLTGHMPVVGDVISVSEDLNSPKFLSGQHTNLYVAVGDTARLVCAVRRVYDKSVLWVRSRDLNILSFDNSVFTADPRVGLKVENGSYVLDIKKAQVRDSGRYECQINTEPKMSLFFNLTVLDEPMPKLKVWISGPADQRAPRSHTMTFTCEAEYVWKNKPEYTTNIPLPQINLHWLHNEQPITLQTERGGILVDTDRTPTTATSRLTVADVTSQDEGQYTCIAGQSRDHLVFRLEHANDEYGTMQMEAMQRDQSNGSRDHACVTTATSYLVLMLVLITNCLRTYRNYDI